MPEFDDGKYRGKKIRNINNGYKNLKKGVKMKEVKAFDGTVFELNEQGDPAPNGHREYENFYKLILLAKKNNDGMVAGDGELKSKIKLQEDNLQAHIKDKNNPHETTKLQIGLENVDNVRQASEADFDAHEANQRTPKHITEGERSNWNQVIADLSTEIQDRIAADQCLQNQINSLANLGHYVGAFDSYALLPKNTSDISMSVSENDFATVRADETQDGATTRYVISAIDKETGNIDWKYDITYGTDITGKLDKPIGDGFVVCNQDGTVSAIGGANAGGSGLIVPGTGEQEKNADTVVLTTIQSVSVVGGSAMINKPMNKALTGKGGIEVTSENGNIIIDGSKAGGIGATAKGPFGTLNVSDGKNDFIDVPINIISGPVSGLGQLTRIESDAFHQLVMEPGDKELITREYADSAYAPIGGGSGDSKIPAGGTNEYLLGKASDKDFDLEWKEPARIGNIIITNSFTTNVENFPLSMGIAAGILTRDRPIRHHSSAMQPARSASNWVIAPFSATISRIRIILTTIPGAGALLHLWVVKIPRMLYNLGTPAEVVRRIDRNVSHANIVQGMCAIDLTSTEEFNVQADIAYAVFVTSPNSNAWQGVGRANPTDMTGLVGMPRPLVCLVNAHNISTTQGTAITLSDYNPSETSDPLWWSMTTRERE